MRRPPKTLTARKKRAKKSTARKKSKAAAKKTSAPESPTAIRNLKGSVTLHLEAQHGREFTEAELIDGLSEDLREAWQKLRDFAAGLGTPRIYASALSIMFARKVCYLFVRPKKTFLEVWIFLPHKVEGLKFMASSAKKVRYCNLFKLVHPDQVEAPLTDWIHEAFDYAPELN
jgi:hypothetical protein